MSAMYAPAYKAIVWGEIFAGWDRRDGAYNGLGSGQANSLLRTTD